LKTFITAILLLAAPLVASADCAEYEIVFEGIWNDSHATLPFPGGAHFTALIGDTHAPGAVLWAEGDLASFEVELVAELGSTGFLSNLVSSRIKAGTAGELVVVSGISSFPGERSAIFGIDSAHPEISLVSMVAPSPDWFVGVSGLSLRDESGWIDELSVELTPYDAGTEDGSGFSLNNLPTSPQQLIQHRGAPFLDDAVIARLHFTRVPEPHASTSALAALVVLAWMRRRAAVYRQGPPPPSGN
jgi:hypothetical protein